MHANRPPNRCPVSDTELLAYRDRELPPARQRQIADHVGQCAVCQARLSEARHLVSTLTLGTPARDDPAARAAIHDRIAAGDTAWWRHRALIATALPVALLVIVLVGFYSFRGDDCQSCPPLTPPLQITAITGLPAGWGSPLTCQPPAPASQARVPANQAGNAADNVNVINRPVANVSAVNYQVGPAPAKHLAAKTQPGTTRPPTVNAASTNPTAATRPAAPMANTCTPGQQAGAPFLSDTGLIRSDQPGT